MENIIREGFETGMLLGGFFGIVGYLIGLCINLLNEFGRG